MEPQAAFGTASSFNWGNLATGVVDTFGQLANSYAQIRLAEKQAENSGLNQAVLNTAVEKPYNVGAVPAQSLGQTTTATQVAADGMDTKQMLIIGGGVLLAIIIYKKVL